MRRVRMTAFRWGLAVGAGLPVLAFLVGHTVVTWLHLEPPPFYVQVLTDGGDISRAGGVRVTVADKGAALQQLCRDYCDDLDVTAEDVPDTVFWVRVVDASGRCIACDPGRYVSNGHAMPITQWRVAGQPLRIDSRIVSVPPKGWSAAPGVGETAAGGRQGR